MKNILQSLQLKCLRCGHSWLPRILAQPKQCPACKSLLWNQRRKGGAK